MKKTLLALALASASLAFVPAAFAQDAQPANGNYQPDQAVGSGNWFIGANAGQTHIAEGPYNDHPAAYSLTGGYRWKVGQDLGLGVDVGYNDLGNLRLKNVFNSQNVNQTSERQALRGWTAGVNGKINVYKGWYFSGRAGVYGWKGDGYSDQDFNRHHLDKVDYYAGAGTGYDFNDHFSLGLAYDYYHASKQGVDLTTDAATVSAEYRF